MISSDETQRYAELSRRIDYLRGRLARYTKVEHWDGKTYICEECGGIEKNHYEGCEVAGVEPIGSQHYKIIGAGHEIRVRVTEIRDGNCEEI